MKNSILFFVVIGLLTACDNNYEKVEKNIVGASLYFNHNKSLITLTDSLKTSANGKANYSFDLHGSGNLLSTMTYTVTLDGNTVSKSSMKSPSETSPLNLTFTPTTTKPKLTGARTMGTLPASSLGLYTLTFLAGTDAKATLNLLVFNNLPPVAKFVATVATGSNYAYTLNASASVDQDRHFGGKIVLYQYTFTNSAYGNQTIVDNRSTTTFHFPGTGTFGVSLIVTDNDGAQSASYSLPTPIVVQ